MARCWEERGCDEEMQADCAHATVIHDMCPTKCVFSNCERPQHELTDDPELVFASPVDRNAAIKQVCLFCAHFLTRGPKFASVAEDETSAEES